jgi:hypothetical protein
LCSTVLGSQLFSGFWIEWMIEHPTKSNSKNLKKLDLQYTFNVKNPKKLDFWIFSVQSNPIIQHKSSKKSKNPNFWIFDIKLVLKIQLFKIFGVGFGDHPIHSIQNPEKS